jgi:hypothetical protein
MSGLSFFQPNPGSDRPCPVCGTPRPHSSRYPDSVCADCVRRAVDERGRSLVFSNLFPDSVGGFQALYADTRERVDTPDNGCVCFIDGVRCWAREAYFGGVVVQPERAPEEQGGAA